MARPRDRVDVRRAIRLYESGLSFAKVAARLGGISGGTIRRRLLDAGVRVRTRDEYPPSTLGKKASLATRKKLRLAHLGQGVKRVKIGQRFGDRKVTQGPRMPSKAHRGVLWGWECSGGSANCVKEGWSTLDALRRSRSCTACGLARGGVTKTVHGSIGTEAFRPELGPMRRLWIAMLRRCYNPADPNYANYGGRGITVCDRWRIEGGRGLENYIADLGPRPPGIGPGGRALYTNDRIDNDGNYEPTNCRWATMKEQRANRLRGAVCAGCGKTWTSEQSHCTVCHESFASLSAFDKHLPSHRPNPGRISFQ